MLRNSYYASIKLLANQITACGQIEKIGENLNSLECRGNFENLILQIQFFEFNSTKPIMDPVNRIDVKKTIEMFELQVDEQMLPQGTNPIGLGNLLNTSEHGLSHEDIPKLILGHVQPQTHVTEHGTKAEMEKRNIHKRAFGRDAFGRNGDPGPNSNGISASGFENARTGLPSNASADSVRKNWDEMVKAKNKAKFNPRTLKIVRDELDNLMKISEGLDRSDGSGNSGTSTSTWASFAPIQEEAPIEKIIKGYAKMSDEDKVNALKMELPPFDVNDIKYLNLTYALGKRINGQPKCK